MTTPTPQLPQGVLDAIELGQKIEAIKLLREATGLGLKDARDAVEAAQGGKQSGMDQFAPPSSAASPPSIPLLPWLLLLAGAACVGVFLFIRLG